MKIFSFIILIFLTSCSTTSEKSNFNKTNVADCSEDNLRQLQSEFDAAASALKAAQAISDRDPNPENNAITAAASVELPMYRFRLDNARLDCSSK